MTQNLGTYPQPFNPALPLFWRAIKNGWLFRLWARLTHCPENLLDLDETLCCADAQSCHYAGRHPVEMELIQGTQGKSSEFDAKFYPFRETCRTRWLNIAMERLHGHDLPPVDLVEVDGIYYVRDGHHRISVARSLGQAYIDAEIVSMSLSRRMM